mmetsp:Transcript_19469/g.52398  ORF Transcript_19469/g.52398 Transcript_19469/m.52398 type:complete len:413 (+) Transcript_19469:37-1275(+)
MVSFSKRFTAGSSGRESMLAAGSVSSNMLPPPPATLERRPSVIQRMRESMPRLRTNTHGPAWFLFNGCGMLTPALVARAHDALVIFFLQIQDGLLAALLISSGAYALGLPAAAVLFVQWIAASIVVSAFVRTWHQRGEVVAVRTPSALLYLGPLVVPVLDVFLLISSFGVPILSRINFISFYCASRLPVVASLEALPWLALEIVCGFFSTEAYDHVIAEPPAWAASVAPLLLGRKLVIARCAVRVYAIVLSTSQVITGAWRAEMTLGHYLEELSTMGATLPVHSVRTNMLDKLRLRYSLPRALRAHLVGALADNTSLRLLDLSGRRMGDDETEQLAVLVLNSPVLRELRLARNHISDRGGLALEAALRGDGVKLELLDLERNHISDPTKDLLRKAWRTNEVRALLHQHDLLL